MRHRKNNLRVYVQRSPVALYSCKRRKFCIKIFFVFVYIVYIYVHILNNHVINTAYLISSFLRALCTTGLVAQGINTHPNILPLQISRDRGKEEKRKREKRRVQKRESWTRISDRKEKENNLVFYTLCITGQTILSRDSLLYIYVYIYIYVCTYVYICMYIYIYL